MENNNIPSTPLPSMAESERQYEQEIISGAALGITADQNTAFIENYSQPLDGLAPADWRAINPQTPQPLLQIVEPGSIDPACACGSECGEQKRDQCCGQCETKVQNSSLSGSFADLNMDWDGDETIRIIEGKPYTFVPVGEPVPANAILLSRGDQTMYVVPCPDDGPLFRDIKLDPAYEYNPPLSTTLEKQYFTVLSKDGDLQDQPTPTANEEPEPAGLPLFSAEQMQEMQAHVIKESAKRYKRENFIPLPGEKGLFSKVMEAIVGGLRMFPKTSAFITPAALGGILQACAPTMFVIPYVAAQIDEDVYIVHSIYSMLAEAARDHAEAMVPGTNHEDPELVALRDKLNEMIDCYAQKLSDVFTTLDQARYVMGASALQDSPIYHTPVIIKQINANMQELIDRDSYSKAFHRQDASTTFCNPPDILGVDVLQVLGHLTSQPDIGSLQLHLLTVAYGASKVMVGPEGDLEFADDIIDRIGEVLAPQRIWFAQTATWKYGPDEVPEAPVAG